MAKWTDVGNIWTTLREVDVSVIRAEAERPFSIACVGHVNAIETVNRLLHSGADRYGPTGIDPVELVPLDQVAARAGAIRAATMLIIGVDTRVALPQDQADSFSLISLGVPALVVLLGGAQLPQGMSLPSAVTASSVVIADPAALDAPDKLATAVLDRLPAELQLAAARRLPGLRSLYTRELIGKSSFSNATYAFASGLPEQIPVLSVPFAMADLIILTKNQAIMVYRMALAFGAPPDFQDRIVEIAPVIGGGFIWRQLARSLVGLVPLWGFIPKIGIAYGGTYATGVVAWRWFAYGEMLSADQVRKISADAMGIGRQRAKEIVDQARKLKPKPAPPALGETKRLADGAAAELPTQNISFVDRIRKLIPTRRKSTPTATDKPK
ncbi:MAG: hypothetical protein H7Z42_19320 [Roseiflexaceae bacterium]|nr:hypothetical protein [Roseiflexaceae bacterium]